MTDQSNSEQRIGEVLAAHGVSRRQFLKMCGVLAATLALPVAEFSAFAQAVAAATRPRVIWLEFQDCTGDSESFLRAFRRADPLSAGVTDPGIVDLLLDTISLDYHETLMTPSGTLAEKSRNDTLTNYAGQYIAVVEGSIPAARNGVYCTIGGRTALSIAQEVCSKAKATITVGSCGWDGGLPAARPNPTGAVGVKNAVPGLQNLVSLPGCPANVVNIVATIVYIVSYNRLPPLDGSQRPTFAYGKGVHEQCERLQFNERDQYVRMWGDAGHRQGWCLEEMGCKGPDTRSNCPVVKWVDGTCWPIAAGHGCIGCTNAGFWDRMTPFYTSHGHKLRFFKSLKVQGQQRI